MVIVADNVVVVGVGVDMRCSLMSVIEINRCACSEGRLGVKESETSAVSEDERAERCERRNGGGVGGERTSQ